MNAWHLIEWISSVCIGLCRVAARRIDIDEFIASDGVELIGMRRMVYRFSRWAGFNSFDGVSNSTSESCERACEAQWWCMGRAVLWQHFPCSALSKASQGFPSFAPLFPER